VFAELEVFALVFAVAELSREIVVLVVAPGVVFVVVSTVHVSEHQACGGIPAVSRGLIAVSVVVLVDLDSSERPKFLAFPNVDYHASSSSSDGVVCPQSVHNSIDVHANDDLCSILSNLGQHQNKILEQSHNKPSLVHDNVSDTNDLPMDATTSHSRKIDPHLCLEQHKHRPYQVALLPQGVPEIRWVVAVVAEEIQCVYLHLPSLE